MGDLMAQPSRGARSVSNFFLPPQLASQISRMGNEKLPEADADSFGGSDTIWARRGAAAGVCNWSPHGEVGFYFHRPWPFLRDRRRARTTGPFANIVNSPSAPSGARGEDAFEDWRLCASGALGLGVFAERQIGRQARWRQYECKRT